MSKNTTGKTPIKFESAADREARKARVKFESATDRRTRKARPTRGTRARPRTPSKGLKIAGGLFGVVALIALIVVGVTYKSAPDLPPRKPGTELMEEYVKVDQAARRPDGGTKARVSDYRNHYQLILGWLKDGNITTSSKKLVTVRVKGKTGTVAEFEIMLHTIRFGDDVSWFMFPLDGPHSLAACKMLGLDLPTKWMAQELRIKAFAGGGKVRFIAELEIKDHLGEPVTSHQRQWTLERFGQRKGVTEGMTPKFIRARGEILLKLLAEMKLDPSNPISGHFKEVIQDPRQAARKKLATYPGHGGAKLKKNWRDLPDDDMRKYVRGTFVAQIHPVTFHDYSHGVRCVKPSVTVGDKKMTMKEFFGSKVYAKEFGFTAYEMPDMAYKYPDHLVKWLKEHPNR